MSVSLWSCDWKEKENGAVNHCCSISCSIRVFQVLKFFLSIALYQIQPIFQLKVSFVHLFCHSKCGPVGFSFRRVSLMEGRWLQHPDPFHIIPFQQSFGLERIIGREITWVMASEILSNFFVSSGHRSCLYFLCETK